MSPLPANGAVSNDNTAKSKGSTDIFATVTAKPRISLSSPQTSPLNLMGKLETWGIGPATPVSRIVMTLPTATGAQLKELFKKLPDGITLELSIEKEDD